ncbi:glycosyltransferase family 2 protein [Acinetobacter indicus]|uniref:glycosyltransferase family 2 protein n=1 Tax=Acinetobacter indicus TaxID=756892 RepID=UPI0025757F8B|nr:glycosyltransferase family A protein [Acinetobacter indicus]MDM1331001.1 glycosyltransferase family 2 protein [Acinetobacter indicus]
MVYFSIIIPLFNKENLVLNAINSIIKQDYKSWELIIVNDGSTDSSYEIVQNFLFKIDNSKFDIKLIHQKNQGVSVARNHGVKEAKHQYICFLDADDEWYPDFLYNISSLINLHPNAIFYSLQHESCIDGKNVIRNTSYYHDNYKGYVENFFKSSLYGSLVNSSKVCLKKKEFLEIGGFPVGYKSGEDLYVWMELALKGKLAFYNRVSSRVNVVTDSSRVGRDVSIPYPFTYYSIPMNKKRLTFWAKIYLMKIYMAHFKESFFSKNYHAAKIRAKSGRQLFPVLSKLLLLILFCV